MVCSGLYGRQAHCFQHLGLACIAALEHVAGLLHTIALVAYPSATRGATSRPVRVGPLQGWHPVPSTEWASSVKAKPFLKLTKGSSVQAAMQAAMPDTPERC